METTTHSITPFRSPHELVSQVLTEQEEVLQKSYESSRVVLSTPAERWKAASQIKRLHTSDKSLVNFVNSRLQSFTIYHRIHVELRSELQCWGLFCFIFQRNLQKLPHLGTHHLLFPWYFCFSQRFDLASPLFPPICETHLCLHREWGRRNFLRHYPLISRRLGLKTSFQKEIIPKNRGDRRQNRERTRQSLGPPPLHIKISGTTTADS